MAITGVGFDGSVDEVQFARLMSLAGVRYAVASPADLAATSVPGVRSVSIAAGTALGAGVHATSTSPVVLPLPTPTAGQWHVIALRRDWSANSCVLVSVPGETTSSAIPAGVPASLPAMQASAGTVDDQPLCWAWVNVTTTSVLLFDLRALTASARLASLEQAGVLVTGTTLAYDANVTLGAGCSLVKTGQGIVTLTFTANRSAGFSTNSGVAVVPAGFRPPNIIYFGGASFGSGSPVAFSLDPNGIVLAMQATAGHTFVGSSVSYKAL